jgi:hypothetical protein
MKTWGSGGIAPSFETPALDRGQWSTSRSGRFAPGERAVRTHRIGGWMVSRIGLHVVERRKILLLPGLELGARSLSLYHHVWKG